ncbi:MAG: UDP-N-acetylglucosamine 1-carboxyvinyltransferase [Oscillospiraceae bacterium]|nr:UDP-N-acetylglucosamine 1-carboxyvinyltransferase [Oscillospiraceae bacterium]
MIHYTIEGGRPLSGTVSISGAKNAALAIIPAAVLVRGTYRLDNVPNVHDVCILIDLLRAMGVTVKKINNNCYEFNSDSADCCNVPYELARRIRASYYLVGACLGRFGKADVAMPGGCDFGVRPIDQHLKGFQALGATCDVRGGAIIAECAGQLTGSTVYLDNASVGATINIMLAAALAEGTTVIEAAGKEPHIVDLANFLNFCGAEIRGAGTDVIKIHGKKELYARDYAIIPDQIEAGTYMAAAAATGGEITLLNVIPKHLECISVKLLEMGVEIEEGDDTLTVRRDGETPLTATSIKTMPYPGFPTDMHPQMGALLTIAEGTSMIAERVWENRFRYVNELRRMGADVKIDGRVAVIEGVKRLSGAPVQACDLRAGAAAVIAGLAAWGTTTVTDVFQIERGYEDLVGKLQALGANIQRAEEPEEPTLTVVTA